MNDAALLRGSENEALQTKASTGGQVLSCSQNLQSFGPSSLLLEKSNIFCSVCRPLQCMDVNVLHGWPIGSIEINATGDQVFGVHPERFDAAWPDTRYLDFMAHLVDDLFGRQL